MSNPPTPPQHGPIWRCPSPKVLPLRRGELVRWLTGRGAAFYLEALMNGSQQIRPPGNLVASAARLASDERQRVSGELFWVSEDMTELARHAGRQLTQHGLYLHELPSQSGFMVFAAPVATAVHNGVGTEIVAVSWGHVQPPFLLREGPYEFSVAREWDQGAVWFTFYSNPRDFITANQTNQAKAKRLVSEGPFMPDNELVWRLGTVEDLPEGDDITAAWGKTVCAAWLLMRQPLAGQSTERPTRQMRRRLDREGLPSGHVRLIQIRRPERRSSEHTGQESEREYSHRWWVGAATGGYWRHYHCGPKGQRLERRWISPHLAGPDDKPVRGTERVIIWDQ